ncbi:MAG TPA: hypothetical protein VN936_08195 [Candidatus Acidoferrum sp.]|nr:hypothetical protein [Candidatus Acidoferrum sp.]
MLFKNVLKLKIRLFTCVDEIVRVHPATIVLNRFNEFCRSVAEREGVGAAAEAAAVSVERLNEYRPINVSRGVS